MIRRWAERNGGDHATKAGAARRVRPASRMAAPSIVHPAADEQSPYQAIALSPGGLAVVKSAIRGQGVLNPLKWTVWAVASMVSFNNED